VIRPIDEQIIALRAAMKILKDSNINDVALSGLAGALGERIIAQMYSADLAKSCQKGYDVINSLGSKRQVKTRAFIGKWDKNQLNHNVNPYGNYDVLDLLTINDVGDIISIDTFDKSVVVEHFENSNRSNPKNNTITAKLLKKFN